MFTNKPLAVSSKNDDKMLISSTKDRNPNNTSRTAVAMILLLTRVLPLTANNEKNSAVKMYSQSLARVLTLTANSENILAIKLNIQIHMN